MGQSYRIRSEIGINKTINVQIDQDFDFIELLSLKIQQEDIYTRSCANYGVLVGRVTANNGFGIPNARVSIFIPIENIDESNPVVSSIYPYKSPTDKNEDGYRYNLLPYEKSYSKHAATGTLPTRLDVLTGKTAIEIYDKYYKFTAKTNESGDYMIMGVPLGNQTVVMDVDLSDIGEFSLTPQDLIRMGIATEVQVGGNQFKTSNDLSSLPQLVSISKSIDVSPLWGDPDICQLAISRVDFDLRDEANIDIQPTAVFMGSIYSSADKFRVRSNCKPKDNLGNLCGLDAGPGQILAIRQTVDQDSDGNPVLEQYQLEQAGNIIDGNGVWLTELPMNLEYVITNEFGEKVISNDPTIGIPTKGKYRFKIKWQQGATLSEQTRRAYFLVPNVREYGWTSSSQDPNYGGTESQEKLLKSSYYFGLSWTGYTDGLQGSDVNKKLDEIIDCQDTFYEFNFNKVYTVAGHIDQYKKGARGRFIGIKEIDDDSCSTTVNKFPVNEGFRNFDLLFFIFSILFQVVQIIGIPVLIIAHLILGIYSILIGFLCALCRIKIPIINVRPFGFLCNLFNIKCEKKDFTIKLSMITYPDCEACECRDTNLNNGLVGGGTSGVLSYFSDSANYYNNFQNIITKEGWRQQEDISLQALIYSQAMGGNSDNAADVSLFKLPKSIVVRMTNVGGNDPGEGEPQDMMAYGTDMTLGERINIYNGRNYYFGSGLNKIKVTFESDANGTFHFDNTITVIANTSFNTGQLLTTVDPATSTDSNFLFTATTNNGPAQGLPGTTKGNGFNLTVEYANPTNQLSNLTTQYKLLSGGQISRQLYPMDREYFQVITAITISDASKIWKVGSTPTLPSLLNSKMTIEMREKGDRRFLEPGDRNGRTDTYSFKDTFENFDQQYILILQRGVDPYSPLYKNKYGIGKILGLPNEDDIQVVTNTRLNIPIQKLNSSALSVQSFTPSNIFYPSYFFTPSNNFSAFTSSTIGYYGAMDATYQRASNYTNRSINGVTGVVSSGGNRLGTNVLSLAKYDNNDDISGGSFMWAFWYYNRERYSQINYQYFTPNLYPTFQNNPMKLTDRTKNVMRTDRLPSSDQLNGQSWTTNPALLQQNNNFQLYTIPELTADATNPGYSTGASQVQPDLEDQAFSGTVFASFSCPGMVSLSCYSGSGFNFGINENCRLSDPVERGCYILVKRPILDLIKDLKTFNEWGYRYRFFYGLCRGVLAQSFMNNWINGSLFAFPIQTNTYFDRKNQPYSTFCKDLIYFDKGTNNFYYRSSPYNKNNNKFIGKDGPNSTSVNTINLLFPTTLINLGPKDSFYQEITFDPANKGYVLDQLNSTTYNDTSDMVNLFVISRIVNSSFLSKLISVGDNGLDQLFTRDSSFFGILGAKRIDGDLAQMMSINSEIGNISFSPEFYQFGSNAATSPVYIDTSKDALIGIFFSSTSQNLQFKDYVSPGRIDFRGPVPNQQLYPYQYGIKSQTVPFYQWGSGSKTAKTIFGNQLNNWQTTSNDIVQGKPYQSLDRLNITTPSYFQGANISISDTFARGYIFEVSAVPTPNATEFSFSLNSGKIMNKFIVGAPFHFYFGLIKGQSALDKFKTKYSVSE
jgi:hypothetical protein